MDRARAPTINSSFQQAAAFLYLPQNTMMARQRHMENRESERPRKRPCIDYFADRLPFEIVEDILVLTGVETLSRAARGVCLQWRYHIDTSAGLWMKVFDRFYGSRSTPRIFEILRITNPAAIARASRLRLVEDSVSENGDHLAYNPTSPACEADRRVGTESARRGSGVLVNAHRRKNNRSDVKIRCGDRVHNDARGQRFRNALGS
jgi:hypothetical protein